MGHTFNYKLMMNIMKEHWSIFILRVIFQIDDKL